MPFSILFFFLMYTWFNQPCTNWYCTTNVLSIGWSKNKIQMQIKYKFHVVVVQNNGKQMYKKVCCTCKVAFLPIRPIVVFSPFSFPSQLSITRLYILFSKLYWNIINWELRFYPWINLYIINIHYYQEYCTETLVFSKILRSGSDAVPLMCRT